MNDEEIKIEKGIPMPSKKHVGNRWGRGAMWAGLVRQMSKGDSAVVPKPKMTCIYAACRRNGWRVRVQSQADGKSIRVWRVK